MHRVADGTLVVLVGPAGSGKSSWAAEHFAPAQIVSSDRLRGIVGESEQDQTASTDAFAVLDLIVASRLRRRLTTVIDSTGLDRGHRDAWRALAASLGAPCVAVAVDTPPAECRRRNAARDRTVPAPVLSRQLASFAALRPGLAAEGFDEVLSAEPVRVVPAAIAQAARAARETAGSLPGSPAAGAPAPGGAAPGESAGGGAAPGDRAAGAPAAAPRNGALSFGLNLSSFVLPGGAAELRDRLADVAQRAEAAGFSAIWVMDHLQQIPQVGRAWEDLPESVATLGYLAAVSRTASIGALVHNVTLREPAVLAKSLATADVLSGGRVWCGLGAGWFEAEQVAAGIGFPPAGRRLDLVEDVARVLPLLWGPGAPPFEGHQVAVAQAISYPRPLQPRIPILIGGQGERRTLKLAAQYADACNLTGDPDAVRRKVAVLRQHCADAGRDPAQVAVTHLSTALVAADPAELDAAVARRRPVRGVPRWTAWVNPGTVEDHVLRVLALQAAGVQQVIVSLDDVWASPAIERYGEVIAAFSG